MTAQRSDFPVYPTGYARASGDAPIMLDGMEVLFDRTVGLAPVTLVPTGDAESAPNGNGEARRR
jgi:hypothetical protein